jgi:dTDP-4-amino-4,6-dideoxygalactose transaminase
MIPITRPFLGEEEASAAQKAILSGWVTQGPKVKEFEEAFASYVGSKYACAVSNCTTALHLSLLAVGVGPGDIVITVSHSFIATANAVRYCGAEPLFVDIEPDTFNMSPERLEHFLKEKCENMDGQMYYRNASVLACGESPLKYLSGGKIGRVAAIMPVHQVGMPCELEAILRLASKFNLPVVEDAACAIGSEGLMNDRWEKIGRPHGDIACFSFHPRKVITTGEGGMLTTNDSEYDSRFRLLRQHGMSVPDTVRHGAKNIIFENYVTTGFNYRMTDIQAAVGVEQLRKLQEIVDGRREVDLFYRKHLGNISWLQLPVIPSYARPNWQSYPVRVLRDTPVSRDELMQYLLDNGVASRAGIMNSHLEPPYSCWTSPLPESEKAREDVLLLPMFHGLTEQDILKVSALLHDYREST